MKFYETADFKALNAKWNKKLEKDNFKDIESSDGRLKSWSQKFQAKITNPTISAAKLDYYRLAGFFLNENEFKSEFHRVIWELHCEGQGVRRISDILKKRGYNKPGPEYAYKRKIHEILKELVREMMVYARTK